MNDDEAGIATVSRDQRIGAGGRELSGLCKAEVTVGDVSNSAHEKVTFFVSDNR